MKAIKNFTLITLIIKITRNFILIALLTLVLLILEAVIFSSDKHTFLFFISILITVRGSIIFFFALLPKKDKLQIKKKTNDTEQKKTTVNLNNISENQIFFKNKQTIVNGSKSSINPQKNESSFATATASDIPQNTVTNTNIDERDIHVPLRMEPNPIPISDSSDYKKENNNTAYFRGGILFNVSPRKPFLTLDENKDIAYNARFIISDSSRYDLENPESIKQIHIPNFTTNFLTRDLGYILSKCTLKEKRTELAVPLAYKTISIMLASHVHYGKRDYFRMIAHLWSLGEIKYADNLYKEVKKRIPHIMSKHYSELLYQDNFLSALKNAELFGKDYLLSSDSRCVCAESAPYCNRLYCVSGDDKRFPKLPNFIIDNKGLKDVTFHPTHYYKNDTITIYKYDEKGIITEIEVDAIKQSNRPFIDDRVQFEKDLYEIHCLKKSKEEIYEEKYYTREHWVNRYYGMLEYREIIKNLPSKVPKSFDGYMRMRNNNTDNFKKLVELSSAHNIKFYI